MDRRNAVLKNISKQNRGIEVGPWFAPLAPKREGYNCLSLDVFDTETLRETARRDPYVPDDRIPFIESVDLIGTSTAIEEIVEQRRELGTFDYVISSHNFEHLPNPIKFLQGCGRVLKNGGFLSMAIPDKRACFDYFRPHTTIGSWIEAFFANRGRPTFAQVFEQNSLHSRLKVGEELHGSFALSDDPSHVHALRTLREAYQTWASREEAKDATYYDAHCWMFTPSNFRLLLSDAMFLGLSPFVIEEVSEVNGNEFYVHLRNVGYRTYTDEQTDQHYSDRQHLLHAIENECSYHSVESYQLRKSLAQIGESRSQVAELCARFGANGKDIVALSSWVMQFTEKPARDKERIQELERLVSQQQDRIRDIHLSTSWKITSPLRKFITMVRRIAA